MYTGIGHYLLTSAEVEHSSSTLRDQEGVFSSKITCLIILNFWRRFFTNRHAAKIPEFFETNIWSSGYSVITFSARQVVVDSPCEWSSVDGPMYDRDVFSMRVSYHDVVGVNRRFQNQTPITVKVLCDVVQIKKRCPCRLKWRSDGTRGAHSSVNLDGKEWWPKWSFHCKNKVFLFSRS